jgi:ATP-dependent exoDNAse (exonuclease V) beta subunit
LCGALAPIHLDLPVAYGEPSPEGIGTIQTQRGELVHHILSSIEYVQVGEVPGTDLLRIFAGDSLFPGLDADEICQSISRFLAVPEVRQLFERAPGRALFREYEYAASDGSIYRMDRVLVDKENVVVVDFKTGKGKGKQTYDSQMASYIGILRDIYPDRVVSGILAYVDLGRLERVQ